jgi:hypothetical protein
VGGGWIVLAAGIAFVLAILARRFTEIRAEAPRDRGTPQAPHSGAPAPAAGGWETGEDARGEAMATAPAAAGRVPVTHPMIRQAAESALAQGGVLARSFVREGAMIYATFEGIPDPAEREAALDILLRVQSGEEVEMEEALWLIRRLTGRE